MHEVVMTVANEAIWIAADEAYDWLAALEQIAHLYHARVAEPRFVKCRHRRRESSSHSPPDYGRNPQESPCA